MVPTRRLGPPLAHGGQSATGQAPDNASFQSKLASGWPTNRQDIRNAVYIVLPAQMEIVPVSALAGSSGDVAAISRTITAPLSQCAALIDPAHHYRTKGFWFSRQYDAQSKTPIKTARICWRGPYRSQNGIRMMRFHA